MAEEEIEQAAEEDKLEEEEVSEEEEKLEKLPFPTATVVRETKKYLDDGKIVKKEVKKGMNRFLGEVVKEVATRMNEFEYTTVDYRMLREATGPYKKVKQLQREKRKIQSKLDSIIMDCQTLKQDLEEKFGESKDLL